MSRATFEELSEKNNDRPSGIKSGRPPELHFGWSEDSPLSANLRFVLFGEGNIPWLVRELIRLAEPDPAKRPRVVIG